MLLISWRQAVLQKQIDYGAKLGHVVLSLAKMELENFFKNVMPVADYFDQVCSFCYPKKIFKEFQSFSFIFQSDMLTAVSCLNFK